MVSMITADQPQPPQALRTFTDRQDKFNGNYNEAYDGYSGSNSKRARQQGPPGPIAEPNDPYSGYRSKTNANSAPLTSSRFQYEAEGYESVNRNGDPVYFNEQIPGSYSPSTSSEYLENLMSRAELMWKRRLDRKTFAASKNNNLALVVSPLAGIAFVAAAAAVAISPVYLTLSSSLLGRKKRDLSTIDPTIAQKVTPEMMRKIQELQVF